MLDGVISEVMRASELIFNEDKPDEALKIVEACRRELGEAGRKSLHLRWLEGVAYDKKGSLEKALECCSSALLEDPANYAYYNSLQVVMRRIGNAITSGKVESGFTLERRLALYHDMVESGQANVKEHAAATDILIALGRTEEATGILEALCKLDPTNREAASTLAKIKGSGGDGDSDHELDAAFVVSKNPARG